MYGAKLLMVRLLGSLLILSVGATLTSCTRPTASGPSRLVIQTPSAVGKAGALASLPSDRKACYAVNVTGENINGINASTCSPATGVVSGYVESGKLIEMSVARGISRKLELYLYLLPVNDSSDCPPLGAVIPPKYLSNTFLVGSATADVISDPTIVEMTAEFPGIGNNILFTMGFPSTCVPSALPTRPARISAAQQTSTGTGLILRARVGTVEESKTLTGTGYKLIVK